MSDREQWTELDRYIDATVVRPGPELVAAAGAAEAAGLPPIAVPAAEGKLLRLLAVMIGARRILEIGTLGGYSTIWLAGGLAADGRVVTLEIDRHHAEVAQANLVAAGIADRVEIRVGPATESLEAMSADGEPPFDLVFIDADKAAIPGYFDRSVALSRPGSVIVVDNVVRNGGLVDAESADPNIVGVRRFHEMLSSRADVSATTIQTVGAKGWDGFTLAVVNP